MWPEVSLDQLGYVSRGKSKHRPRNDAVLYGGQYPFIQTGDIKHAGLRITNHSQTYNDVGLAQSRLWPINTLCITIAANIADTALLGYEACFPDSVIGFIADNEKCDVRFVKYCLSTMQERMQMVSQGATQDNLNQDKLLSFGIANPPLAMQRRIGDILSAYDDLIENNHRRIKLLEEAARRLYREWFVALRFPGHERVKVMDGVPQGWDIATVGDAFQLQRGFDLPSGDRKEGVVPIVASTGVTGFHNEARVSSPGVVTGRSGTLGAVHFIQEDFWPLNTSLWVKEFRRVTPLLAYFILLELDLAQFNSGASVPSLDRKAIHPMPLVVPPLGVQVAFDKLVGPFFVQARLLQKVAEGAKQASDALLPRLMSGTLTV